MCGWGKCTDDDVDLCPSNRLLPCRPMGVTVGTVLGVSVLTGPQGARRPFDQQEHPRVPHGPAARAAAVSVVALTPVRASR
jgi:hypothetical protein